MNIRNALHITMPYMKEIKVRYRHFIDLGAQYYVSLDGDFLNQGTVMQAGALVNYTKTTDETELKAYDLLFSVKLPIEQLPIFTIKGNIELDEHMHRGNISVKTNDTAVGCFGSFEVSTFIYFSIE